MSTQAKPLLTAFGWSQADRRKVPLAVSAAAETLFVLMAAGVVIAALMYWHDVEPIFTVKSVEFTEPDVAVILFALVAVAWASLRRSAALPRSIAIPLLIFFGATTLSAFNAINRLRAFAALIQMLEFVVLIWCASQIRSRKAVFSVLHLILAAFVFQSLLGTWQLFFAYDPAFPWPHGTFYTNQKYSQFMGGAAAIAFALFMSSPPSRRRLVYALAMFILIFGMVIGQERAPWLSFLISSVLVTFLSGKEKLAKYLLRFLVAITLVVALILAVPQVRESVVTRLAQTQTDDIRQNTLLSRLMIWGLAWKLFTEHPILGVGPKNFIALSPMFLSYQEMGSLEAADPHNVWLGSLAEGGVIGFVCYVLLCVAILRLAYRYLNVPEWQPWRPFLLAYLGYHFFMFAMSLNYFVKGEGHFHFLMVGLMSGVLIAQQSAVRAPEKQPLPAASLESWPQ